MISIEWERGRGRDIHLSVSDMVVLGVGGGLEDCWEFCFGGRDGGRDDQGGKEFER
jgi:hypothetical protein